MSEKKKLVCPMCMQTVDEDHMCCGIGNPLLDTVVEKVKEVVAEVTKDNDKK